MAPAALGGAVQQANYAVRHQQRPGVGTAAAHSLKDVAGWARSMGHGWLSLGDVESSRARNEEAQVANGDSGKRDERLTREPAEDWCRRLSIEVRAMVACGYTAGELVIVSPDVNNPNVDQVVPRAFTEEP
jgi:hypothetical protein